MKKKDMPLAVLLLVAARSLFAAPMNGTLAVLTGGTYTAIIRSLVCAACVPKVVKTLKEFPGIESVSVNQEKSTVKFAVKRGVSVKVSKLQAELESASDEMGMGADYTLGAIKLIKGTEELGDGDSKYKSYKVLTDDNRTYRFNARGEEIAPFKESSKKGPPMRHAAAREEPTFPKPGLDGNTSAAKAAWVCPMGHYSSDQPGKCPKCGMELQKGQ